jgi:hypothetical protein
MSLRLNSVMLSDTGDLVYIVFEKVARTLKATNKSGAEKLIDILAPSVSQQQQQQHLVQNP